MNLSRIPINLQGTLDNIANLLKNHEIREKKSTDTDYVLIGLLNVLRYLAEKFPQQNEFVGQKCGIVKEILFHYLFEFPKEEKIQKIEKALPPKCKSSLSRQSAFSLLASLARDTPINIKEIIAFILPIHMYDCIIRMYIETVHGELKESLIGQLYQKCRKIIYWICWIKKFNMHLLYEFIASAILYDSFIQKRYFVSTEA